MLYERTYIVAFVILCWLSCAITL